ncbi:transport of long-chain fatty acid [Acinetobacter sp. ANC 5054]|uniref:transport of long-chain fatty acid n=1 Tax=Acinetobacter sp. ANC 5054 TaxID=1977877 RepID=UPI001D178BC6|nr:transport of long-chain fatty acid [Acinetobacter sp. ANC 5054]
MKTQYVAVAACMICPINIIHAAGLDRSDQSIAAFLEPNNYAELSLAVLDADIKGEVQYKEFVSELGVNDFSTGNLSNREFIAKFALKFQPYSNISTGVIYEQPFNTDISYKYSPVLADGSTIDIESADVEFKSHNLTGLVGYQPNLHWNFYTGLSLQSFKGNLTVSGQQYDALNGYDAKFKTDDALGWLVGISYQLPQYALKTSLTYRSKIKHKNSTSESTLYSNGPFTLTPNADTTIETPQSINFDFQTAISATNLIYGNLRWVNWQNFVIQPPQFNAVLDYAAALNPEYSELANLNLIDYKKDQWSGKFGFAHQFNPTYIAGLEYIWDNGTGNPASTINSSDGYRGIGLGTYININSNNFIAAGIYYLKFLKPTIAPTTSTSQIAGLSTVGDNDAMLYGLKLDHRF